MPVSTIEIWKNALARVGASVRDIALDGKSEEVRQCQIAWPIARISSLAAIPWNFARARAVLAPMPDAPLWGFTYQYPLPSDCHRVLTVKDQNLYPWKVEGGNILSDNGPALYITYLKDVTDPALFDPLFAEYVTLQLATRLATPLSSSTQKKESIKSDLAEMTAIASAVNGYESSAEDFVESDVLLARWS